MSDISDKKRTFVAYFNCNHGGEGHYVDRVIEAGEDADDIMAEELDELTSNHSESGWWQALDHKLKKLKKDGHI